MTKYYQARTQPRLSPALNQGTKHVRKRMYFLPEGRRSVLQSDSELIFDTRSEQVAPVNSNLRLKTKQRHFLAPDYLPCVYTQAQNLLTFQPLYNGALFENDDFASQLLKQMDTAYLVGTESLSTAQELLMDTVLCNSVSDVSAAETSGLVVKNWILLGYSYDEKWACLQSSKQTDSFSQLVTFPLL